MLWGAALEELFPGQPVHVVVVEIVDDLAIANVNPEVKCRSKVNGVKFADFGTGHHAFIEQGSV